MTLLTTLPRRLVPLAAVATVLAIVVPSQAVADRSDLLLALLVLATALGITASALMALRRHAGVVAALSVVPFIVLLAAAWAVGRPFDTDIRHGLLAVGASSAEVASVGLVALIGADATIALGAVVGSLVLSALLGPVALGVIAGASAHGGTGHLLGRFALVVIVPLIVGVAIRSWAAAALAARDGEREGVAALAVAALVYAALSGIPAGGPIVSPILASLAFLAVCGVGAAGWSRLAPPAAAIPGALTIGMRDFAVAAALATQAFGAAAAGVPGIYGVIMLISGTAAASARARRRGNVGA
ncbi:MAG TPA: bile acid:sodium symporter [Solirubrobacteraceae bacterium]|nr:bile acid:sodium symporter [Solirubrobacteraceae bacterium]